MQEKLSTENQRHSLISISKLVYQYLSDIENTISEFNKSSEEIKALRENLLADEFLKIKENANARIIRNSYLFLDDERISIKEYLYRGSLPSRNRPPALVTPP